MILHKSDSSIQSKLGQTSVLEALARDFGLAEAFARNETIRLNSGTTKFEIDGLCRTSAILVEVYSRIGPLRGAQKKKISHDILKLHAIRLIHADWKNACLYIAFASDEAKESIKGWQRRVADELNVELVSVTLPDTVRAELLASQERQKMVNEELSEDDALELGQDD